MKRNSISAELQRRCESESEIDAVGGFYNLHRPHRDLKGKTPYEVLRDRLSA